MIIYIIMAESIEYSSIVKFINDEIIQEKLAHLVKHTGGMEPEDMRNMPEAANPYVQGKKLERVTSSRRPPPNTDLVTSSSRPPPITDLVTSSSSPRTNLVTSSRRPSPTTDSDLVTSNDFIISGYNFAPSSEVTIPDVPNSPNKLENLIKNKLTESVLQRINNELTDKLKNIVGPLKTVLIESVIDSVMDGGGDKGTKDSVLKQNRIMVKSMTVGKVSIDVGTLYVEEGKENMNKVFELNIITEPDQKKSETSSSVDTPSLMGVQKNFKLHLTQSFPQPLNGTYNPQDFHFYFTNEKGDFIDENSMQITDQSNPTYKVTDINIEFISENELKRQVEILQNQPFYRASIACFALSIAALMMQESDETEFLSFCAFAFFVLSVMYSYGFTIASSITYVINQGKKIFSSIKQAIIGTGKASVKTIGGSNASSKNPFMKFLQFLLSFIQNGYNFVLNLFVKSKTKTESKTGSITESKSGSGSFSFDTTKGDIVIIGSIKNTTVTLNMNKHFGIEGIKMVIQGNNITYQVNETPLDAHSYIEGKPVHTALVMTYLVKDKHYNKFAPQMSTKSDSEYLYSFDDDGSVRLFKKDSNGTRGAEIASINTAIRKQLEGDATGSTKDQTEVCQTLFGVKIDNPTCANHFYNILGKSAMGMLKNMGEAAKNDSVVQTLINAQPHIKYEILKNLDWKMKISNGKKEMATPDQWLERLEQDIRPSIKLLASEYKTYLNTTPHVKNILERMVMDLNNNTSLLDLKYKEAIQTPQPAVRKRQFRLSAAQVSSLRNQVLTENVALNTPMAVPGYPGFNLVELGSTQFRGGSNGSYEQHFENIKHSLAGFQQKLSSDTDRKIKSKIFEINDLTSKLDNIHKNITEYTKILRSEKYPTGISRTVTLSDIENLINQYKSGTQEQTKQIVTLSTAFGKIKMLLEKQEVNATKPSKNNFMFDL